MLTRLSFPTVSPLFLLTRPTKNRQQGFTLIELITVVIIISILVGFGVPLYNRTVERARNQEAITNLRLIQAAERIYWTENDGVYYGPSSDPASINTNLHLDLPAGSGSLWGYSVAGNGSANATRLPPDGGFPRTYSIGTSNIEVSCSGTCP